MPTRTQPIRAFPECSDQRRPPEKALLDEILVRALLDSIGLSGFPQARGEAAQKRWTQELEAEACTWLFSDDTHEWSAVWVAEQAGRSLERIRSIVTRYVLRTDRRRDGVNRKLELLDFIERSF